jgi:hypothetical protein
MTQILIIFVTICLVSLAAIGQSPAKGNLSEAEKKAIITVFDEYLKAMQADQPERDRVRERLLTEDYFYMGMDGLPAGKSHVMQRQKRNGLRINSMKMTDIVIRLYGNTAILTMRSAGAGVDMGKPWGGDGKENGHTTVMVKQKGKWRVAADVIGVEVED